MLQASQLHGITSVVLPSLVTTGKCFKQSFSSDHREVLQASQLHGIIVWFFFSSDHREVLQASQLHGITSVVLPSLVTTGKCFKQSFSSDHREVLQASQLHGIIVWFFFSSDHREVLQASQLHGNTSVVLSSLVTTGSASSKSTTWQY